LRITVYFSIEGMTPQKKDRPQTCLLFDLFVCHAALDEASP
jgi:hypothetical protein